MQDYARKLALCGSLQGYDQFKLEWALVCYKLNPSETNKRRLEQIILSNSLEE